VLAVRPDSWNFPLLLHVAGAALLVGALVLAGVALVARWRRAGGESLALTRLAFWTLAAGAIPAYVVMRVGAQWFEAEEDIVGEPAWIGIGYTTADLGALLLIVATVLAGLAVRRLRSGRGTRALPRIAGGLSFLLVVAYVVTIWAMTAKPD
jgi:hypothetical protein